jgi:photosystem II stability/assembly factor-like uncharacterized protein
MTKKLLSHRRVVVGGLVLAFVAVFAAVGAISRSSPSAASTAGATTAGTAPSVSWYWTMAVSPSDPSVLILGTNSGLYRSADGGKTWQPTGPKDVDATSVIDSGSTIYMGGARGIPAGGVVIREGGSRIAADGPSVLAASSDGGSSWTVLHPRGLPNIAVQALAVDPARTTTLYALLNSGTLYRSTDSARSFQLVASKLGVSPWALAITQDDRFVAGDMDSGSHLSANGKSWQVTPFMDSSGGRMVMEYAVKPGQPNELLMSSVGLELSADGGKTWQTALKSTVMFGPVAWAPTATATAYAVGFDGSVWRSTDAGKSWTKVG